MCAQLLQPIVFAQLVTLLFIAVLFLQSGLDKCLDFSGNLAWLQGHFAKSPLRAQVKGMLLIVTIAEVVAGLLALIGAVELIAIGEKVFAMYGAQLAAVDILMLFFGQRMAKDYAGAASLVPYFILCVGAMLLLQH